MTVHDSYDYMTETDPDDVKDAVYTRRHGNLKETYSYDGINKLLPITKQNTILIYHTQKNLLVILSC